MTIGEAKKLLSRDLGREATDEDLFIDMIKKAREHTLLHWNDKQNSFK